MSIFMSQIHEMFINKSEIINKIEIINSIESIYSISIIKNLPYNLPLFLSVVYFLCYIKAYFSKTELIAKDGSIMHQIAMKLNSVHSGYRPSFWCFSSLPNTLLVGFMQRFIKVDYIREVLKTTDGGLVAIDWSNINSPKKLILLIIPGTTGSSKSCYVTHFVDEAIKAGCTSLVLNYRGFEVELTNTCVFSPSFYDDLDMVVKYTHKKYPEHKIFALGISLGGIILGGYLSKEKENSIISTAMIVSSPMNLTNTSKVLQKGINLLIVNPYFTNLYIKYIEKYKHLFEVNCSIDVTKLKYMHEFDELNSKLFGFASCADYYQNANLDAKIENIKVNTLFLNAADDMLYSETDIPIEKFKSNPYTALVKTSYGGHIAFSEGIFPTGCNYVCRMLREYIQINLQYNFEKNS